MDILYKKKVEIDILYKKVRLIYMNNIIKNIYDLHSTDFFLK